MPVSNVNTILFDLSTVTDGVSDLQTQLNAAITAIGGGFVVEEILQASEVIGRDPIKFMVFPPDNGILKKSLKLIATAGSYQAWITLTTSHVVCLDLASLSPASYQTAIQTVIATQEGLGYSLRGQLDIQVTVTPPVGYGWPDKPPGTTTAPKSWPPKAPPPAPITTALILLFSDGSAR